MPRARLTDETIRKLPAADSGTVWYLDDKLPGFQLSIGTRTRTFYVVKSLNGRNVRKKIGEWPGVTAKAAREAAEQLRGVISSGVDPRRKRTATLDETLDDYIDHNMHPSRAKMTQATADSYKSLIRLHCARWRSRDLADITFADLASLHKRLGDRPYTANHVVKLIRALFKHRGLEMRIPKGFFYKEEKRENAISDLKDFGARIGKVDWTAKRAVWLLGAYTGIRRRSLTNLEWSAVDLDEGTIHLDRMKNGLARTLPLSKPAIAVLKEMKGLHPKYVFPRRDNGGPIIEVRDDELPYVFHNTRNVFSEGTRPMNYVHQGDCVILPTGNDPAIRRVTGHHRFHIGLDLGQSDPTAIVIVEDRQYPVWEAAQQRLEKRQRSGHHADMARPTSTRSRRTSSKARSSAFTR